jgi:hypothetical protein
LGDDTSHYIERQGDVSIILFNGQDKTILDVLNVHGLIKKHFIVKTLDEVEGEIKSRRHILIRQTIIANYMPKNDFYELRAISQNHVEIYYHTNNNSLV